MSNEAEPAYAAALPLARLRRAMDAALYRDTWNRTHCTVALANAGRGVAHDPACHAQPGATGHWGDAAIAELDRLDGPGRTPRLKTDDAGGT